MKRKVNSLDDLPKLIEDIFLEYKDYKVFAFFAEMGCGKTTFINEVVKFMGGGDSSSPTFSLVNEYSTKMGEVYHFDLYRTENLEEAYDIGIEDYLYSNNYCFIEWAEKIEDILPKNTIYINIKKEEDSRFFSIQKK